MLLSVCSMPEVLEAMVIINMLITIAKVVVPLLVIFVGMFSMYKSLTSNDYELKKAVGNFISKLIIGIIVFFIPSIIGAFVYLFDNTSDYKYCFLNANKEYIQTAYINKADRLVAKAEESLNYNDYSAALVILDKIEDDTITKNYRTRLEIVYATMKEKNDKILADLKAKDEAEKAERVRLRPVGSYASNGNGVAQPGVYQSQEPDPSAAVNYWKNVVNPDNFIYPKDEKSGLPLGAWPKDYASISTSLSGYKTYSREFIFPTTPVNGIYHFVYDHNGIDIMGYFGTPIYSPVDGTLYYSEWGHTGNRGGDETAYSITIHLNNPTNVGGKNITDVFMTHLSGIVYRCSPGACNRQVRKGELLGFMGNAAGTAESVGWAPHLHMTLYSGSYENGLRTNSIESLYNIPNNTGSYSIKAGG